MLEYRELDIALAALADPTRRVIVERLARGPASAGELAEPLPMSLSAVLQHVRVLEDGGLIETSKPGRTRICQLSPQRLREVEGWMHEQRTAWETRLERLGDALAGDQENNDDR